ncbi:MAG: Glycine--tRNA ligase 1, mitochondrial [Bogoriella megaspora]|nr:MAG: Glycine--tRNA ligase 1, mitochondrial [Bogoriella megaspora]
MAPEATTLKGQPLDRAAIESLLKRRFFYAPTADIYGGVAGFYDFGPPGCSLQANIIETWRRHFVLEEDMLEIDSPMITPHAVLKTSGHVERFCDFVVKDSGNGDILRADHVIEEVLEARLKGDKEARGEKVEAAEDSKKRKKKLKGKTGTEALKLDDSVVQEYSETLAKIDNYDGAGLSELITKHDIRNPSSGNKFNLPVYTQNLMFGVSIGSANLPAYLRPETAQSQFLNFSKLLEFNNQSMPFASASIGKSGHFVDPEGGKKHNRFQEIADVKINLLSRQVQLSGKTDATSIALGEAVRNGVVDNETIGYFIARVQLFLVKIGLDPTKIRFREHLENEMGKILYILDYTLPSANNLHAHYAKFCVDAELLTSYGWIEAVGIADRSAYDLSCHTTATGIPLVVRERRNEPLTITEFVAEPDMSKFGPRFKQDSKAVQSAIAQLAQDIKEKMSLELKENGKITIDVAGVEDGKVELTSELIKIEQKTRTDNTREYIPNVIEPSFGIGRIFYSLCEQVFWTREGSEARTVLSFPPAIAPTKVLLVPLSRNPDFEPIVADLTRVLRRQGLSTRVDDSNATIGKRYSRNDELGTPLGITVDFQSVKDGTITLRDRDTTTQVRAGQGEIVEAIVQFVQGTENWSQISARLPKFEGQELD